MWRCERDSSRTPEQGVFYEPAPFPVDPAQPTKAPNLGEGRIPVDGGGLPRMGARKVYPGSREWSTPAPPLPPRCSLAQLPVGTGFGKSRALFSTSAPRGRPVQRPPCRLVPHGSPHSRGFTFLLSITPFKYRTLISFTFHTPSPSECKLYEGKDFLP